MLPSVMVSLGTRGTVLSENEAANPGSRIQWAYSRSGATTDHEFPTVSQYETAIYKIRPAKLGFCSENFWEVA